MNNFRIVTLMPDSGHKAQKLKIANCTKVRASYISLLEK